MHYYLYFMDEKIGGQGKYTPHATPSMTQMFTDHQIYNSLLSLLIQLKEKTRGRARMAA